ncbi:DUF1212 family protein [Schizosaccharomyces japonicus yFS275]|uniref:DUF1212 family protein n=1 Tax=Schizosaccharomyces japonicus (strain yFS275 / FY16936) TaxID=402676 RepID=B6K879_SCHJY|nr:DUF1212 family protein [Schizosaccharomyces japonicus yFS275]EEB09733.1 DUF1212 family protein [Schizosaccharomyces japonicus yFS275]
MTFRPNRFRRRNSEEPLSQAFLRDNGDLIEEENEDEQDNQTLGEKQTESLHEDDDDEEVAAEFHTVRRNTSALSLFAPSSQPVSAQGSNSIRSNQYLTVNTGHLRVPSTRTSDEANSPISTYTYDTNPSFLPSPPASLNGDNLRRPTLDRSYSAPLIENPITTGRLPSIDSASRQDLPLLDRNLLPSSTNEAYKLVAAHTSARLEHMRLFAQRAKETSTPDDTDELEKEFTTDTREHYRGGVLSNLLKLYTHTDVAASSRNVKTSSSRQKKWQKHKKVNSSTHSLSDLFQASNSTFLAPITASQSRDDLALFQKPSPRSHIKFALPSYHKKPKPSDDELKITVHLADILQRQMYILKLCRGLMIYGAPSHRLEEQLVATARVLEIESQFLYVPGCTLISFGDINTHTSDMHIVRVNQTIDLGKLKLVHQIYKDVLHDLMSVEEAIKNLDDIFKAKSYFRNWLIIVMYGFASVTILPIAFEGGWLDLPLAFVLGVLVGILQIYVAPRSTTYNSLIEVTGAILTSFLSRALGSIARGTGKLFCFSALAEGAIVVILPGYIVLCGSLELQSKNIVAGSVRMFYAIIYSLFLSFGIAIGSALYGWMDHNATMDVHCPASSQLDAKWRILFVPLFTLCLLMINQARPAQWPVATFISCAGYAVNYFSSLHFGSTQIANAIGAFAIGCLGNIYSRLGKGLAFAAVLPAIFVQVPSGLAAQGGLSAGLQVASLATNSTTSTSSSSSTSQYSSLLFGLAMVQLAIGISVGLFASAMVIYPFGKRRSGLFSF